MMVRAAAWSGIVAGVLGRVHRRPVWLACSADVADPLDEPAGQRRLRVDVDELVLHRRRAGIDDQHEDAHRSARLARPAPGSL